MGYANKATEDVGSKWKCLKIYIPTEDPIY
jgi:hypothetical protein